MKYLERIWPPHTHPWPNHEWPPAGGTLSLASMRLPRPCRGSRGFAPLLTCPSANPISPPADGTLSLASLRLPRPCRGSRGFGPLRHTPAHFQFSFHDGMDVRLRGEIGPPKTHPRPNRISPPADGTLSLASLRSRGFEPPWVAPLPPQGSASASFATSAYQKS